MYNQLTASIYTACCPCTDHSALLSLQSVDSDPTGGRPLLRQNFMPSDDAAYREASFARSQDSMTQPPTYSRLAAQSTTGRHVQMSAPSKSRMAPQSSAGSFASVARSEASFVSSIGGSRSKEQALADTYARACARLRALEVCALWYCACVCNSVSGCRQDATKVLCQPPKTAGLLSVT